MTPDRRCPRQKTSCGRRALEGPDEAARVFGAASFFQRFLGVRFFLNDVRFTPESRHVRCNSLCLLGALDRLVDRPTYRTDDAVCCPNETNPMPVRPIAIPPARIGMSDGIKSHSLRPSASFTINKRPAVRMIAATSSPSR